MNFKLMILPAALEGIGMNISCILTHWLLPVVTWRACDPMYSAEDYGLGHTGVDFCYVEAALVADPTVTWTERRLLKKRALGNWNSPGLEQRIWPAAMGLSNSELNNPCWPVVWKIVLGSCGLSYQSQFTTLSSFSKGWAHWNVHISKAPACTATTENGWEIKRKNQRESLIRVHVYAWGEIPLSVV